MILPKAVSLVCPICAKPADLQGTGFNSTKTHHRFCLYCHECHASVVMDVRRYPPTTDAKTESKP